MIKLIENSENSGYLEAKFFPLESLRFLGTFSVFFFVRCWEQNQNFMKV